MFGLFRSAPTASTDPLRAAIDESWARIEFKPDGTIVDANALFEKASGYARDELIGQHHRMLCHPEVAKSDFYVKLWSGLAAGEPTSGRFRRRNKAGEELFLRASYMPVRDAAGKVEKIVKIAVDATADAVGERDARGKIEAASRAQACIEFDTAGTILDANQNFLDATGYRLEEIKGRHHSIFMAAGEDKTPEYRAFWERLGKGEFVQDEFRRKRKDGSDLWISASYNPVKDRYGKVLRVVKYATDITARMQSVEQLSQALERMAEGRLDFTMDEPLEDAYEPLRANVNRLIGVYADTVDRVNAAMATLRGSSSRISESSVDLSARAERQAATLEEIAATIEELSGTISTTADNSRRGAETAEGAAHRTREGQEVIESATAAVRTIEESSRKINEINSVIESIAFQTNLLALNAAVEAARAGEAGKGFAVVAAEVRTLAQRSSDAASDTAQLIKESAENVEKGAQMMDAAVEVFGDIRKRVDELAKGIRDIETANREQSEGVNEINAAVADLDDNTQGNAHASSENAAVARSLDEELSDLAQMLAFFRMKEEARRRSEAA
ncbi:methyl-accepting chemotaxis protein [Rhodovulum sp. DZ06]|uniref:methyl-accepting chemotaxis protein n=1 Tax=Rhodovulum sp. DZ06 TaxID=3425126 RepID=UPI003D3338A2